MSPSSVAEAQEFTTTSGADAEAQSHHPLEYRPALDGLRAIAVYLVVAFHAGVARLSGGFIGVDTFFVLSGYLVTRVIFSDLLRGSFALATFYARRVRRLLPAAIVTLVLVSIAWVLLASPVDRRAILGDARSAALYYSNWHFAHTSTDYFASNNNPTPLLHFWSLSVEEQFYVIWPLTVVGLWIVARRNSRRVLQLVGAVALLGIVASLVALVLTLRAGNPTLAYYGTHTRAYQLLAGVLLAVIVQWFRGLGRSSPKWSGPLQFFALISLLVLGTSVLDVGPSLRGVLAATAAVSLVAGLEGAPRSSSARALGIAPLTFLGKISYGTYLWHYPTIIVIQRFVSISPRMLAVVTAIAASSLAALSYQLMELPIRHSRRLARHSRAVIAAGLFVSLLAGLVIIPRILHSTRLPVVNALAVEQSAAGGISEELLGVGAVSMAGFDLDKASEVPADSPSAGPGTPDLSCTTVPLEQCIIHQGTGRRILLLGDSHAAMLVPAFRAIAKMEDVTVLLAARPGCPWQRTLVFTRGDKQCSEFQDAWYNKVVPAYNPDVIVLASRATDHKVGADYSVASTDKSIPQDASTLLATTTRRSVALLEAPGRLLVVVEPVPVNKQHTLSCLSAVTISSACAFVTEGVSPAEQAYRALPTSMDDVRTIDIDPLVCPRLPICDPIVDGLVVRRDHDHISAAWSAHIAGDLDAMLRQVGVFPPLQPS